MVVISVHLLSKLHKHKFSQLISRKIVETVAMHQMSNKKLSCCWETVRRESMPRIAEMDMEMTT